MELKASLDPGSPPFLLSSGQIRRQARVACHRHQEAAVIAPVPPPLRLVISSHRRETTLKMRSNAASAPWELVGAAASGEVEGTAKGFKV